MIGLLLTLVLFPLVGFATARFVGRTSAFLMGLGVVGGVLHVLTLMRVPPLVTIVGLLIASVIGGRQTILSVFREKWPDRIVWPPLLLALIPILFLLFTTAVRPLTDYDGRAFWLLKAKAIAHEGRIDGPFFQQKTMYDPRNEYPLLVPFDAAALMIVSGDHNDRQVRWIYVLALAALALHARRFVGPWPAALIPWIPQFAISNSGSAATAYNDVPLAAFGACAFFELIERKSPLRFGLWLSFLVLSKNEGLPFALLLFGAGVFVFRRRVVVSLAPLAAAVTTLLVWRGLIPGSDEENLVHLLRGVGDHLDRFVPALLGFTAHSLRMRDWGLFWAAAIVATFIIASRDGWKPLILPWFVIGGMSALYVAVYMVTTWNMVELMNASADRLLMHIVGPAVYLIALSAQSRYSPAPHSPIEA
jgi:hypothetical protein